LDSIIFFLNFQEPLPYANFPDLKLQTNTLITGHSKLCKNPISSIHLERIHKRTPQNHRNNIRHDQINTYRDKWMTNITPTLLNCGTSQKNPPKIKRQYCACHSPSLSHTHYKYGKYTHIVSILCRNKAASECDYVCQWCSRVGFVWVKWVWRNRMLVKFGICDQKHEVHQATSVRWFYVLKKIQE